MARRMKLHIVLAALCGARAPAGVARHAAGLARSLVARDEVAQVILVAGRWQLQCFQSAFGLHDPKLLLHPVDVANRSVSRNLWYWQCLPRIAAACNADAVHYCFPAPVHRRWISCPVVTSLHDLYPYDIPENFGYPRVLFNRWFLRQSLASSDAIACVSQETLRRLRNRGFARAAQKALVIPNCVDMQAQTSLPAHPLLTSGRHRFLLFVGQHRQNKNIPLLLRAFSRLLLSGDLHSATLLTMVGESGPTTAEVQRLVDDLCLQQNVLMLESVPDGALRWLYEHAELLIAPSRVEGFGLPVAEALACGTRVVCSDLAVFREIGGSACHYFDLDGDAAQNLLVAARVALREPARAATGLDRYSTDSVGEQALALYLGLGKSLASGRVRSKLLLEPKEGR
jgi:glycosyltransferase involved in cell wall biosynthesis